MVFDNGSQITSMPSASDPARGESATLIVVDEWAFLPNPEEAWASVEPVADVGGRDRITQLDEAAGAGNRLDRRGCGGIRCPRTGCLAS